MCMCAAFRENVLRNLLPTARRTHSTHSTHSTHPTSCTRPPRSRRSGAGGDVGDVRAGGLIRKYSIMLNMSGGRTGARVHGSGMLWHTGQQTAGVSQSASNTRYYALVFRWENRFSFSFFFLLVVLFGLVGVCWPTGLSLSRRCVCVCWHLDGAAK